MTVVTSPRTVGATDLDVPDGTPPTAPPAAGPPARPAPRPRVRRRIDDRSTSDRLLLAASAVNAALVTWLVYARLTDGTGWLGYLLTAYALFLILQYVATREQDGAQVAADRTGEIIVTTGLVLLVVPFVLLIAFVVASGFRSLRLGFFIHAQAGISAEMPATAGGGSHAIVGTLQQVGLALLLTLPLSLLTAAFLNETRSRWRRPVRILVDAMSGLPSILAGLFIYAIFVIPFADTTTLFNFNGFMACLALSVTMLPTITRTVEVVLRLVPDGLRESALALGSSRARMVWSIVLPSARTGVTTSVVLGIARAVGKTAPLLFTAFGLDYMNANPFSGPQEALPIFIFRNIQKPSQAAIDRALTAALVLMLLVVLLFAIARFIGRPRTVKTARRNRRLARRNRRSPDPTQPGELLGTTDPTVFSGPEPL
jgi:phosphate transport system permease protein